DHQCELSEGDILMDLTNEEVRRLGRDNLPDYVWLTKKDKTIGDAAKNGNLIGLKYFIDQGTSIHTDNDIAIRLSAEYGHLFIVKYLVERYKADIHAYNSYALRKSAENGHLAVVEYLVEHGANVHADDDYSLRHSAENGYFSVVRYLVEHRANVTADSNYAMIWSNKNKHYLVRDYLNEHGAPLVKTRWDTFMDKLRKILCPH